MAKKPKKVSPDSVPTGAVRIARHIAWWDGEEEDENRVLHSFPEGQVITDPETIDALKDREAELVEHKDEPEDDEDEAE